MEIYRLLEGRVLLDLYLEDAILTLNVPVDYKWYTSRTLSSHHWRKRHGEVLDVAGCHAESGWRGHLYV